MISSILGSLRITFPGSKTPSFSAFSALASLISLFSFFSCFSSFSVFSPLLSLISFFSSFSLLSSLTQSFATSGKSLSKKSFKEVLPTSKLGFLPVMNPRMADNSLTRSSPSGVSRLIRISGRSFCETKGCLDAAGASRVLCLDFAMIANSLSCGNDYASSASVARLPWSCDSSRGYPPPITMVRLASGWGRFVEQGCECGADWLTGILFVVQEARTGIDLEAVIVAVRILLEVDAGQQQIQPPRKTHTRFRNSRGQRGGFHFHVVAFAAGVAIVHRIRTHPRGKQLVTYSVHPHILSRYERLELGWTVAQQRQALQLVGLYAPDNRSDSTQRLIDDLALALVVKAKRRFRVIGNERRRCQQATLTHQQCLVSLAVVGHSACEAIDHRAGQILQQGCEAGVILEIHRRHVCWCNAGRRRSSFRPQVTDIDTR